MYKLKTDEKKKWVHEDKLLNKTKVIHMMIRDLI